MKYEDIKNDKIKDLVKKFYIYQGALIKTPLGQIGANNQPQYPKYFNKYQEKLKNIIENLQKEGISIEEVKFKEESNHLDKFSFLQNFEKQTELRFILVMDNEIIQLPNNYTFQIQIFINDLPTPWQ